jgi:WD40 repeat protein
MHKMKGRYSPASLQTREYLGHKSDVLSCAFSTDGKRIASGGMDKLICIWWLASTKDCQTLKGHTGSVDQLLWDPTRADRLATGSQMDCSVRYNRFI